MDVGPTVVRPNWRNYGVAIYDDNGQRNGHQGVDEGEREDATEQAVVDS